MARLSINSASSLTNPHSRPNDTLVDLSRLLTRLQQTVLRADAERERKLRTSEYERRRVSTNIDHARDLLTRLEQEALGTSKFQLPRHDLVADLNRKRELLEQLTERIRDLEEIAAHALGEDGEEGEVEGALEDNESESGEDILAEIIATPSESLESGTDLGGQSEEGNEPDQEQADIQPLPQAPLETSIPPPLDVGKQESQIHHTEPQTETSTTSTLRARTHLPSQPPSSYQPVDANPPPAQTTSRDQSRSLLFGNRSDKTTTLSTTEAVLDHQRQEQEYLSESILQLAQNLKQSSLSFAEALETDKETVNRAGEGLARNERGLEAAAKRMGQLIQATEGKGWIGRMMLYAWIYGLMLLLVVMVFALPKLRF
ncbi:hypothetical protein DL546_006427 [Coniochaeta pulveracea]|uniref:Synaptobrevin n=1 Tax=Coniochaeta pulveracea TaxID=177199 RepID=A0A420Y8P0_9PEZI|nr:hypothetical protein DL546_006427 [Coniochaeta pulveracea]